MRTFALTSFAAAALLLAATQARADIVKIDGFTYASPVSLNVSAPAYSGPAGQLSGWLNGNKYLTYCTDLLQQTVIGTVYTNYSVKSGLAAFGAAKSQMLDRLMSAFMATGAPSNAASSASAQAMIWEVLYETGSSFNLGAGSFSVSTSNTATQTAMQNVNWASIAATPIRYHVDQLFSPTAQDFMVITAVSVPEPSSIALVAAAVFGMGVVARRTKKAKSA